MSDPVTVALRAAGALESCGLTYLVGGSLASPISGEPRSTLDVDMVVAISESDVAGVVTALRQEFEVDDRALLRAAMSDRQWRDILGILLVEGAALDRNYLDRGATTLGVSDLLQRAYADAGQ